MPRAIDLFSDNELSVKDTLTRAYIFSRSEWEKKFVAGLIKKHKQLGDEMFLSSRHYEILCIIADNKR